jgi:hypothetical protein
MKHWKLVPVFLILSVAVGAAVLYRAEALRSRVRLADARREIDRLRAAPPTSPVPEAPASGMAGGAPSANPSDPDLLLAQLQELEQLLQEQEAARPAGLPQAGTEPPGPGAAPQSPRNWMEELKKTDPARYEEIVRRREQARQEMQAAHAEQSSFFLQRAEEARAAEEQAHYQQIAEILDGTWQMMELLRSELPAEQRRELRNSIRDNLRTLTPLLDTERNKEWRRLSLELGATEAEAQVVAARINQVLRVTNARNLLRHGPGGGGSGSRPEPNRNR